jgi:hypothetical protein
MNHALADKAEAFLLKILKVALKNSTHLLPIADDFFRGVIRYDHKNVIFTPEEIAEEEEQARIDAYEAELAKIDQDAVAGMASRELLLEITDRFWDRKLRRGQIAELRGEGRADTESSYATNKEQGWY